MGTDLPLACSAQSTYDYVAMQQDMLEPRPVRVFALIVSALVLCLGPQAASAMDAALPVAEVAPGVFVHAGAYEDVNPGNGGDIANLGFVVGDRGVAVIDTGNAPAVGRRLRAAIKAKTDLPIYYVINTHVHPDHTFGNTAFVGDKPEFVGHAKLARAMAAKFPYYLKTLKTFVGEDAVQGIEAVAPTRTVAAGEEIALDLGGRKLTVTGFKTAHTDNDVTVFDSKTATLFAGDLLFVDRIPALDGSLKGWLNAVEALKKIPAALAVPGHGPASVPWPQALDAETRYFNVLLGDIRKIQKEHGTLEQAMAKAGGGERDKWALFDDYNPRNVTEAFVELEWE
jgi:quinoprotein relay system zinc metallohydrolase 2